AQPGLAGVAQRDERAAAALHVQHGRAAEQDHVGAGDARGARPGASRPGQRGTVRLGRIGGGEHERVRLLRRLAQLAQAFHAAAEGELRAAEALDEVAAPAEAERLERAELRVDGAVAAWNPLRAYAVARHDPLALEQQLRE